MNDRSSVFLDISKESYNFHRTDSNDAEKALYLVSDAFSLVSVLHSSSKNWTQTESEGAEFQIYLIKKMLDDAIHFIDLANPRDYAKED